MENFLTIRTIGGQNGLPLGWGETWWISTPNRILLKNLWIEEGVRLICKLSRMDGWGGGCDDYISYKYLIITAVIWVFIYCIRHCSKCFTYNVNSFITTALWGKYYFYPHLKMRLSPERLNNDISHSSPQLQQRRARIQTQVIWLLSPACTALLPNNGNATIPW